MKYQYSITVQWSDEDQAYLVTLPEFGSNAQTHGDTYREAFKNALEVLDLLIESFQEEGLALPKPWKYGQKRPEQERKKRHHAKSA
jgi:predicted RNase H-like HicB family nuclease